MFTRRPRLLPCLCAALVIVCSSFPPASAQPAPDCPEAPVAPVQVPNLRRALAADTGLVVVAVGSSSTQGAMASSRARSYPAVLQAELEAALPRSHVAVLNRGIGGQDVVEQLARLDADVIAVRPALVVWQVGANAVLRRTEPETFKRLVAAGVRRLHAAGADVVPVDDRRAPACSATTPSSRAGNGTGIRPPGPLPRASCTTTTGASAASPGRWPPCRRVWIRAGRRAAHRWPSGGRRAPNAPNGRGEGYPAPSPPSSPSGNPAERSPAAKCSRSSTRSNGLVLRKRCTV